MPLFSSNAEVNVQSLWSFFASWTTDTRREAAASVFELMAEKVPEVSSLARIPQSAPWHTEGFYVRDHLVQALLGLRAIIEEPEAILALEEIAEDKDLSADLRHLFSLIARHDKFLTAYIFAHDLGKAETAVIWNGQGTLPTKAATTSEIELFDKERRAFFVHRTGSDHDLLLEHERAIGLRVSYPRHGFESASETYREARLQILDLTGAGMSYAKLLAELIRGHIDWLYAFRTQPDEVRVRAMAAVAGRAGVAVDVFLDLVPACMVLDMLVGSQPTSSEDIRGVVRALKNFFAAERLALPARANERELVARRAQRVREDVIFKEAKLDADSIFALLKTPVGPARGQVMNEVLLLLKNPDAIVDFAENTEEIRRRARLARDIFIERGVKTNKL